jgi:hypothetical protein
MSDEGPVTPERIRALQAAQKRLGCACYDAYCNPTCPECAAFRISGGPTHCGSRLCQSGSINSGGPVAHCSCDLCF